MKRVSTFGLSCLFLFNTFQTNSQQFADEIKAYNFPGSAYRMSTGDINQDGHVDLLVASSFSYDMVSMYLNDGNGNFYDFEQVLDLDWPDALLADMDGDGDLDIVTSSFGLDRVGWYKNHGRGKFTPLQYQSIKSNVTDPDNMLSTDIDGDGDMDVIFHYDFIFDKVYVAYNNGSGIFNASNIITTNGGIRNIAAGDIDGDGDKDILCSYDNKVSWLENTGSGFASLATINSTIGATHVNNCLLVDYDNDGDKDIFYGSITWTNAMISASQFGFVESYGDGTFADKVAVANNVQNSGQIKHADMDNDGDMDFVLTTNQDNKILWYENLGCGEFAQQQITSSYTNQNSLAIADVDNNGTADVFASSGISVYKNLSSGFDEFTFARNGGTQLPFALHTSDLDNDGDLDLISTSIDDHKVAWYENIGSNRFGYQRVISTSTLKPNSAAAADFDGDGDMDIAVSSDSSDNIVWYKQQSNLSFSSQTVISTGVQEPTSIYAADLNADGKMDLLSSSYQDNKIAWYEGNGNGTFGSQKVLSTGADGAQVVMAAKLDADTFYDVLYASINDNTVGWFENNGDETFSSLKTISSTDTLVTWVDVMDVEGDGDMDVFSCGLSGTIICYKNNGLGSFTSSDTIDATGDYGLVSLADVDHDGRKDILATEIISNRIVWFRNLGSGSFSGRMVAASGITAPRHVLAVDVDHDTDLDIVTSAYGDNDIFLIRNGVVNQSDLFVTACDSFVSPSGQNVYKNSGIYMDTLANQFNGDSIVSIDLYVVGRDTLSIQRDLCFGDTTYITTTPYTSAGSYSELLTNQCGLDSLVQLDVSITHLDTTTIVDTICSNSCFKVGETYYTQSGTYIDTLPNKCGFDSLIFSTLVVNDINVTNFTEDLCNGDTFFVDTIPFVSSGMYTVILENQKGCDSTINLDLSVTAITSSITVNGGTINAIQNSAYSYQWLDCDDNFAPIPGATSSSFTPGKGGSYAVLVSSNGCEKQSGCKSVDFTGIVDYSGLTIDVVPNPTEGTFQVYFDVTLQNTTLTITDLVGKVYQSQRVDNVHMVSFSLEDAPDGVYFVHCQLPGGETFVEKIIKQ